MNDQHTTDRFLSVLEAHKGILYKIAGSYSKSKEERKDLVQEMVYQLWKSFDQYDDQYKYSTWIYRIALNVAISFYRKDIRRQAINFEVDETLLELPDSVVETDTDPKIIALKFFISQLSEMDKALMLLYLEEKTHKEIAHIIGLSESNVGTKIGRIKALLRDKFSNIKTL